MPITTIIVMPKPAYDMPPPRTLRTIFKKHIEEKTVEYPLYAQFCERNTRRDIFEPFCIGGALIFSVIDADLANPNEEAAEIFRDIFNHESFRDFDQYPELLSEIRMAAQHGYALFGRHGNQDLNVTSSSLPAYQEKKISVSSQSHVSNRIGFFASTPRLTTIPALVEQIQREKRHENKKLVNDVANEENHNCCLIS